MENNVHENKKLVRQANCSVGEWVTLGCCAEFINGDRGINYPKHSDYVEVGIPFINTGHITPEGWLDLDNMQYITHEKFTNLRSGKIRNGDIVYCLRGSTIGKIARVNLNEGAVASSLVIVRALDGIHQDYLFHFLSINYGQGGVTQYDNGSAQPNLSVNTISKFKIFLPPYETQVKIANFINAFDVKITLNHQINQTLEQMAQVLFKSWFVDFDPVVDNALDAGFFAQDLDLPDELLRRAEARQTVRKQSYFKPLPDATRQLFPAAFEECAEPSLGLDGWVPKGWKYENFEYLLSMTIGGDWGKDLPDESHSVQSRIVRGTDIPDLINGQLSKAPLRWVEPKKLKSRQIEAGDIIIEVSGGSPTQSTGRSIFMSDLMLQRLGGIVEPASFCRRFKPKSINFGLLGFLHLQKIYADGKMWEYQNQSTGIANFQTKFFLEAEPVLLPSSNVLDEFCKQAKPLIDKSQSNEQITLANLRDTLLPKLISGELQLDNIKAELATDAVN